jgi:hypothetical protein
VAANGFATPGTDPGRRAYAPLPRESGAALLMLLLLIVVVVGALISDRHSLRHSLAPASRWARDAITARSLSDAKSALMAWAVTLSAASGRNLVPGLLPFPDRNRDGRYDGRGDCVTFGLNEGHLLGRLPWAGDAPPCPRMGLGVNLRDGAGEPLWYAVSRNLLARGRGAPLNPDSGDPGGADYPWIRLRNSRGELISGPDGGAPLAVAAVIIAPGPALGNQDRGGTAPGPAEFLDSIEIGAVTFDNADADGCPDAETAACGSPRLGEEFIVNPNAQAGSGFNDRLVYITVAELMRAVEKRVLGDAALALTGYREAFGAYPWLARASGVGAAASFKSTLSRDGRLPVHLPDELFSTRLGGDWNFIDSTPSSVTRHSGDPRLVPPLVDAMSGSIQVPSTSGRCLWSDWTRADCTGSQVITAYYRQDLGAIVARTIAFSFSIVDDTPQVFPPTSADVRRRSLSIDGVRAAELSSATWSIRITDDDGVNMGQREIVIDVDTRGEITLSDIRYDLSVVYDDVNDARDELPEWFARNDWHHFIFVALSRDAVAGGDADGDGHCSTPLNRCLTLTVSGNAGRSDVSALLLSSGARLTYQDRSSGDCGAGADALLCAYLEGDNGDKSTLLQIDSYARAELSTHYNDQVRIVDPLLP